MLMTTKKRISLINLPIRASTCKHVICVTLSSKSFALVYGMVPSKMILLYLYLGRIIIHDISVLYAGVLDIL